MFSWPVVHEESVQFKFPVEIIQFWNTYTLVQISHEALGFSICLRMIRSYLDVVYSILVEVWFHLLSDEITGIVSFHFFGKSVLAEHKVDFLNDGATGYIMEDFHHRKPWIIIDYNKEVFARGERTKGINGDSLPGTLWERRHSDRVSGITLSGHRLTIETFRNRFFYHRVHLVEPDFIS